MPKISTHKNPSALSKIIFNANDDDTIATSSTVINPLNNESETRSEMETPSASELYEMQRDQEEAITQQNQEQQSSQAAAANANEIVAASASSEFALHLAEVRVANAQNESNRANRRLDNCMSELAALTKQHATLTQQHQSLVVANANATASLRAEFDVKSTAQRQEWEQKVADQRRETLKKEREVNNLRFQRERDDEHNKITSEHLAAKLAVFFENERKNTNSVSPSDLVERIAAEIKAINEAAKAQALNSSREIILNRIFQLAADEVDAQVKECIAQPNYAAAIQYSGYKGSENFVRNECLFSGVSSVEKSFFLKCSDRHLAQAITATGELNKDLFYFTFHGTRSLQAARAIQCEGLDPARRAGQAMGPGEYQGVSNMPLENLQAGSLNPFYGFAVALGYSSGTVLVNLVFKPPAEEVDCEGSIHEKLDPSKYPGAIKFHGPVAEFQGILVIKNPTDRRDGTFMLPLGTIFNVACICQGTFGNSHEYTDENGVVDPLTVAVSGRTCKCAAHNNKSGIRNPKAAVAVEVQESTKKADVRDTATTNDNNNANATTTTTSNAYTVTSTKKPSGFVFVSNSYNAEKTNSSNQKKNIDDDDDCDDVVHSAPVSYRHKNEDDDDDQQQRINDYAMINGKKTYHLLKKSNNNSK